MLSARRGELADLDRQELALAEQQGAQEQAQRLAASAFAVVRKKKTQFQVISSIGDQTAQERAAAVSPLKGR